LGGNDLIVRKIHLVLQPPGVALCCGLTAQGFQLSATPGATIRRVLLERAAIPAPYLDTVVQSVFHNGRAVDDDRRVRVGADSIIALSAAMPGLVGAVFRKNSPVAGMRTFDYPNPAPQAPGPGEIHLILKFFNQVNTDLGPIFLKRGIRLPGAIGQDFFHHYQERLAKTCRQVWIDGSPGTFKQMLESCCGATDILLTAVVE
jgi:hypothetical protein